MRRNLLSLSWALTVLLSAGLVFADGRLTVLPAPSFPPPAQAAETAKPVFTLVRATTNQITDEDAWVSRNGLTLPARAAEGEEVTELIEHLKAEGVPVETPATVLDGGDSRFVIFGPEDARFLIATDPQTGAFKYGFDFSAYGHPPSVPIEPGGFTHQELTWAVEEGGTLYVSHGHRTYAKDSKGLNAYITAIDIKTKTVRWRSPSLVSNAENFLVIGDDLIAGYGFTAEPDYLYRLRRSDGRVLGRVKLKSGPEHIVEKDGLLYIRCYNTDAVYKLAGAQ
jgi:hypothetical protein